MRWSQGWSCSVLSWLCVFTLSQEVGGRSYAISDATHLSRLGSGGYKSDLQDPLILSPALINIIICFYIGSIYTGTAYILTTDLHNYIAYFLWLIKNMLHYLQTMCGLPLNILLSQVVTRGKKKIVSPLLTHVIKSFSSTIQ